MGIIISEDGLYEECQAADLSWLEIGRIVCFEHVIDTARVEVRVRGELRQMSITEDAVIVALASPTEPNGDLWEAVLDSSTAIQMEARR